MSALRVENPMIDSMAHLAGRVSLSALLALALGACATYSKPVNQELALRVAENGERVEAACDLSNDRGSWSVVSPVVIGVTRSDQPLKVECSTPEGSRAVRVFDSLKHGSLAGIDVHYSYPEVLELTLERPTRARTLAVDAASYARIDDVSRLPQVDAEGREGYRRFLAGESPRAFAISDNGRWVRVNAARGAARVALSRCQTYGGRCRLYAVDDEVIWDQKHAQDMVALY